MGKAVIAIKDFEMPESCYECGAMEGRISVKLLCALNKSDITNVKWDEIRPESCPLVEIPDHVG